MPRGKNSRLKDPGLYEKLSDEGNSKEKSARVADRACALNAFEQLTIHQQKEGTP